MYYVTVTDAGGCIAIYSVEVMSDQYIPIDTSHSYFSTYIDPFNLTTTGSSPMADYFYHNGIASQVIQIKDGDGGNAFTPQYNLNFYPFYIQKGYQAEMLSSQILYLKGKLNCPEDNVIALGNNWNLNSYLRTTASPAPTEITNQDIIIVKEDDGTVYWPAYGWNGIGDLEPGEGYYIKADGSTSFYYTNNDNNLGSKSWSPSSEIEFIHFTDESNLYTGYFMVVMFPLSSFTEYPEIGSEIGLIGPGGNLVGRAVYTGGNVAVVVYGDIPETEETEGLAEGEGYTLNIWDGYSKNTKNYKVKNWLKGDEFYEKGKVSIAGELVTEVQEPGTEGEILVDVYPNPNMGQFYLAVSSSIEENAKIEIYNLTGALVYTQTNIPITKTRQIYNIDLSLLSNGVYNIRVITVNNSVQKNIQIIR